MYSSVQLDTIVGSAFTVDTVVYIAVQFHLQRRTVGHNAGHCLYSWVQLVTVLACALIVGTVGYSADQCHL